MPLNLLMLAQPLMLNNSVGLAPNKHMVDLFLLQSEDPSLICSGPRETLASHRLVFEAERSRLENRVVFCGTEQDAETQK